MNPNSPVKMLPQEVKTPLVPDSEMCTESSTMGFAGDKRKAGPHALSAPDAKKTATSDASPGLPKEDKTPQVGSSARAERAARHKELVRLVMEGETTPMPEGEGPEKVAYDTTGYGDVTALEAALDVLYPRDSTEYVMRFNLIKSIQCLLEEEARAAGRCGKIHVRVLLNKMGHVALLCRALK